MELGQGQGQGGVFPLLSALCGRLAGAGAGAVGLRARCYELLLGGARGGEAGGTGGTDPLSGLITRCYVQASTIRNTLDHRDLLELRELTGRVRKERMCEDEGFEASLRLLLALQDSVQVDRSAEIYARPFSMGLLDQMLPRLPREEFGSPLPYQYYPAHLFELPYSFNKRNLDINAKSSVYTNYTEDSFKLKSESQNLQRSKEGKELQFFSLVSLTTENSSKCTLNADSPFIDYSRLMAPRDLAIPKLNSEPIPKTLIPDAVEVMYIAKECTPSNDVCQSLDIWELASAIDKNVPDDIWDIACKLPPVEGRQLIAMNPREVTLWKELYSDEIKSMHIVSEMEFIRHLMYLTIGVESSSFPWNPTYNSFSIKPTLSLEGISRESLHGYVAGLTIVGTCYRRLYAFAYDDNLEVCSHGFIFEAAKTVVRRFLPRFHQQATKIYEECVHNKNDGANSLPTLLQIIYHLEPLKYEIETVASIYKVIDSDSKHCAIPKGAGLMSYLYNEISLITHSGTCCNMFSFLYYICKVYFKFIERFIFEGSLDDRHSEFFIRKDLQYVNSHSKRYWDKGFYIADSEVVPEFLKGLAKYILLCGKSFRLLKLCNPNDPLVLLISTDHPTIRCCTDFAQIQQQQQILDLYRTRCLFVSGEPVTFDQIVLRKEAERKAFTEMAAVKQAETMEKIVAERKRLAQLIIAEKQHSLRVLEAAIAETKAVKNRGKQRERERTDIEVAIEKARDEADAILKDQERNKIMEYYSKLNLEVEKRKVHTEWKIKRLQLDQTRMQLLSTEERNLKREKLELEHSGKDDGSLSNSIYSTDSMIIMKSSTDDVPMTETGRDIMNIEADNINIVSMDRKETYTLLDDKSRNINDEKSTENQIVDTQGNIIPIIVLHDKTIETVDGKKGKDNLVDNSEFCQNRLEAIKNKRKVLAHEFQQLDSENNITSISGMYNVEKSTSVKFVDSENNLRLIDDRQSYVCNEAFMEAKKNKLKVLGSESDYNPLTSKSQSTEFLSFTESNENLGQTVAATEAKRNKLKILGTDDDHYELACKNQSTHQIFEPNVDRTDAVWEAMRNKLKVLGTVDDNYQLFYKSQSTDQLVDPNIGKTDASIEAIRNRAKVLGTDIDTKASDTKACNRSQSIESLTGAQKEALANKIKVLGTEYNLEPKVTAIKEPLNLAQEEALVNKRKVLGTEYNLEPKAIIFKDPANFAQEEAVKNKNKFTASAYSTDLSNNSKAESNKRAGLTLDLGGGPLRTKENILLGITPTTGGLTPGDFFPQLDLETPTTAEVPFGPSTAEIFSPIEDEMRFNRTEKEYLSTEGFKFPSIVLEDENAETEAELEKRLSEEYLNESFAEINISKHFDFIKSSIWNSENQSYNFNNFDPFGVKGATFDSKNFLSSKMNAAMKRSCYTNPEDMMREVEKKPYKDIFHSSRNTEEDDMKFTHVNIATLTACFQRSIMLPLSYQLEMVNNSILTHYLVDLDMYEHLRSLKDYFFLMDGEFSKTICQNLFQKLVKTINPEELLNFATLHSILDKALGSSIASVNKFSENLSFTISEPPLSFHHSSPDVLQCLSLAYTVAWPMNIILSAEALQRYARVFQFLVKMRRISWILGQDFEVLKLSAKMSRKESRNLIASPQYNTIQLYRHVMSSFVRALDNYIVTTCIHSSWMELESDLKKARTLDDLYDCHVVYVKKVLFRCLLNKRSTPVMKLLNDIFTVVLRFSHVLKTRSWLKNELTVRFVNPCFNQLQELFHLFEKLTRHLHKTITRLMECGYQPHLAELLTMINLNGYYDPVRDTSLNKF